MLPPARRSYVRWRILALLFAFGSLAYFQQKSLTVAAERIIPELQLTQMQLGWLQWAFLIGYTSFQFLGGVLGQWVGARRSLVVVGLLAFVATLSTPLTPSFLHGTALFGGLLFCQLLLGLGQAPLFPVAAGVTQVWFPMRLWAIANGIQPISIHIGAALTPPLIVLLMQAIGWQQALFWTSLPALGLIALWGYYARNSPQEHPKVSSEELAELAESLDQTDSQSDADLNLRRIGRLLSDRSLLLLSFSYCCMNYVFYLISNWCFLYLVQERHLSVLASGWLAAIPPLGAALGAGLGGVLTEWLGRRIGTRWGYRLLPLIALPMASVLLLFAVKASSPVAAVSALACGFGCLELTEGAYWTATMQIARADTMAATGLLNTGGNMGGLIGIPIVAYLTGQGGWATAFILGAFFALVSALAWLGIDATTRVEPSPSAGD